MVRDKGGIAACCDGSGFPFNSGLIAWGYGLSRRYKRKKAMRPEGRMAGKIR